MIQMEYHYGYENLVKKLKSCGLDVKYTEPKKSYTTEAENPNMYVGYIYAKRRVPWARSGQRDTGSKNYPILVNNLCVLVYSF